MLGTEFSKILEKEEIPFAAPSRDELNLLDRKAVVEFLGKKSFTQIIHCVAYTNIDVAEGDGQEACFNLNTESLKSLLDTKIPIIHFSTDYVFGDFETGHEIVEDDKTGALNVYGKSKEEAEKLLEASNVPFWNIRTSWLFGPSGSNFVSIISSAAKKQGVLRIVDDQVGRPTYAPDLAAFVIENFIKNKSTPGHYHLQNSGKQVSWAEFAEYFLRKVEWEGRVEKITAREFGAAARRPRNSFLKNTKLVGGLRDWREAVDAYLEGQEG